MLVIQAIRNELAAFYSFTQAGSLKGFGYIFEGAIELLPTTEDLERIAKLMEDFVQAVKQVVLDGLDLEMATILIDTLGLVLDSLIKKQNSGVSVKKFVAAYLYDFFAMLLKAHGVLLSFKILGKVNPTGVAESKEKIFTLFPKLASLSDDP